MISKDTIERIKVANDICEVAGEMFDLQRTSKGYKTFCTHDGEGQTPSLNFYKDSQTFYCFGCAAGSKNSPTGGSDVVSLIMWQKCLSWEDALKYLAERASIKIEEVVSTPQERALLSLYQNKELEIQRYQNNLSNNIRTYFHNRGIDDSNISKWRLGENEGLPIYPIMDHFSRPISSAIRRDQDKLKYVNGAESPIFLKRNILYGLNFAKSMIKQMDYAIIVEGYNDVILLQKYGVPAIGMMGITLTKEHREILFKLTKNLILFFDGDEAGIISTSKRINELVEAGFENVDVINIAGKDPDDIALLYKETLPQYIQDEKLNFYAYLLGRELMTFRQNVFRARNKSANRMKEILTLVSDETTKTLCQDQFIKIIMEGLEYDK